MFNTDMLFTERQFPPVRTVALPNGGAVINWNLMHILLPDLRRCINYNYNVVMDNNDIFWLIQIQDLVNNGSVYFLFHLWIIFTYKHELLIIANFVYCSARTLKVVDEKIYSMLFHQFESLVLDRSEKTICGQIAWPYLMFVFCWNLVLQVVISEDYWGWTASGVYNTAAIASSSFNLCW